MMDEITVRFLGVSALGGGSKRYQVPVSGSMSVRGLLRLVSETHGLDVSPEQLEEQHLILVQGRSIADLEHWDTVVRAGDRVSVVPLVGGG